MDLLETIKNDIQKPEHKRFKLWSYFNYHLTLYQDFNAFNVQFLVSHSNDDEHNWIVGLHLLFWGVEYSWNSRKKS
jgi:hypothetical protein